MSVVTGIIICMSLTDNRIVPMTINTWLDGEGFSPLNPVEDFFSGDKHPQMTVLGGGYNYFPNEKFIKFFKSLRFEYPENAVLILKPEDGPTATCPGWG